MASLYRLTFCHTRKILTQNCMVKNKYLAQPSAYLSTSKKNKDAVTVAEIDTPSGPYKPYKEDDDNFISYGYSQVDRDDDRWNHHLIMFSFVTLGMCLGAFIVAYKPEGKGEDWVQREAYLLLSRRHRDGLPLIDPNFIPPEKITLPTDEQLGSTEIII